MYGIAKMVRHGDRIFQHSAESLTHAHPTFVTLQMLEQIRFAVWRGALKIRVSLVRFQSRPPYLHRSFQRDCGVFICSVSVIHTLPTHRLLATRRKACCWRRYAFHPSAVYGLIHPKGLLPRSQQPICGTALGHKKSGAWANWASAPTRLKINSTRRARPKIRINHPLST
jgi:hypothetical protein